MRTHSRTEELLHAPNGGCGIIDVILPAAVLAIVLALVVHFIVLGG